MRMLDSPKMKHFANALHGPLKRQPNLLHLTCKSPRFLVYLASRQAWQHVLRLVLFGVDSSTVQGKSSEQWNHVPLRKNMRVAEA
jgi:hypothetical protein